MPAILAGLVSTTSPFVRAQGAPSKQPVLRIETGMHTAGVKSLGVDRASQFLVTASNDKTVRVWELATGRLLRVLRVAIDEGNQGKLYAVAISPDGRAIAAAGWTSVDGRHEGVYLFDRESGRMLRRLAGLSQNVNRLTFSPDGARLAASLGGDPYSGGGTVVWRTSDWTEVGRTATPFAESYGADFDNAGRLAESCLDGAVRLYDRSLRLLATQDAPGGKLPFEVRFSPDGRRLAVGYADSVRVDVLSGDTLTLLYHTESTGLDDGETPSVVWSADGTTLYAGGGDRSVNAGIIRRWSDEGRGHPVDRRITSNSVMDLAALPQGGIAYSAGDPVWGVLDSRDPPSSSHAGFTVDFRGAPSDLLTDAAADAVRFIDFATHDTPAVFRLPDRSLTSGGPAPGDLRFPRTDAPGLSVTEWRNTTQPKLNAVPLRLDSHERSRSLAIAPDGARFLLGTSFSIRLFDRRGQELWSVSVPDDAWAVNISGDGRYAIAACGDGTIRWYAMTDGKELLTFFPHADGKRWVIWTRSGYYDASPGGEDLIGWHVNNGLDQAADFFPAGQFRDTYYRPDVIGSVLEAGDEARAVQRANQTTGRRPQASVAQQLPPVVEIVSPADRSEVSATSVSVRFTVRTPSGEPVTNIRALVNGRPVQAVLPSSPGAASASGVREVRLTVPEQDSEIAIIAENSYAASVPATVRVAWRGAVPRGVSVTDDRVVVKPKLYVLAVGVSQYSNSQYNLAYAAKDARDFVGAMQAQKDGLYRDVIVYTGGALTDSAATKDEILDGLDWIRKETTSNDVAMVFLAGHGVNDQNNYYFFYPFNVDPDRLLRTGLPFSDIKNAVSAIAGKAVFFVDTCHSGNSMGLATRRGALDINVVINELSSAQNGVVVFSASTGSESSYERPEWNNGAFTKAVVEGLAGAAAIGTSGRITYNMLNIYVSERVKDLTKGQQHPTMISPQTVPDFPIAVKR